MGSQDESSLAARRARLRGSLAKQALPADPYSQDPYARAKTPEPETENEAPEQSDEPGASSETAAATAASPSNGGNGSSGSQSGQPGFRLEDLTGPASASDENSPSSASFSGSMPATGAASSALGSFGLGSLSESLKSLSRNSPGTPGAGSLTDIADWSTAEPVQFDTTPATDSGIDHQATQENNSGQIDTNSNFEHSGSSNAIGAEDFFGSDSASHHGEGDRNNEWAGPDGANAQDHGVNDNGQPAESPASSESDFFTGERHDFATDALPDPVEEDTSAEANEIIDSADLAPEVAAPAPVKESRNKKGAKSARASVAVEEDEPATAAPSMVPAADHTIVMNMAPNGQMHVVVDQITDPARVIVDQPAHVIIDKISHVQVLDTLTNMDQAMGACAMNLSALQATANQQTEALRNLSEILQNQTFSELGMSLSGLMESLSAALEPMKAVSELVPAIDQLVQVMEAKIKAEPEQEPKLSPDQLVMNLADHLSSGAIDPWTFKSAYMAVFPSDHPADLLHRLVDLLGTSRLSGNLFRAAYDAVQAPDPPKRVPVTFAEDGNTVVKVVQDESLVQQLDELRQNQNEFEKKMGTREAEFNEMLTAKEQELQDAQELLNSRWEEFNQRYDELSESLQKRDEMIQEKESEIARKDNENGRLRNQMDELKDMVSELQKQFSASKARAEALSKPGFFDSAPAAGATPSLFDAAPAKPLFQGEPQQHQAPQPQPIPQPQPQAIPQPQPQPIPAPVPQQQPAAMMQPAPQPAMSMPQSDGVQTGMGAAPPNMPPQQAPSQQAIPGRQNQMTTPFTGAGPGSYGSGVRAQVFEVIVRQALAGAPWREICAGPMQVNNISPDEVEAEVKRRQALLKK